MLHVAKTLVRTFLECDHMERMSMLPNGTALRSERADRTVSSWEVKMKRKISAKAITKKYPSQFPLVHR